MAAAVTAAGIATALPFAYFLVRYVGRRWQRIVLLAVIVPFWTSYLLRAYAWQAILGEKGALNQFLMGIGLIDEPSRLFVYNDLSVWLVLLYVYFPFAALALYTALEKFDFNQLNAAQDLGARPDQAFRRILLPQIRPGVITACIFVFVPILGEFLTPTLVGGAQGALIANLIINFFRGLQYTTMAAFSFVIAGFVIVVVVIFRRFLRVEDVVARGWRDRSARADAGQPDGAPAARAPAWLGRRRARLPLPAHRLHGALLVRGIEDAGAAVPRTDAALVPGDALQRRPHGGRLDVDPARGRGNDAGHAHRHHGRLPPRAERLPLRGGGAHPVHLAHHAARRPHRDRPAHLLPAGPGRGPLVLDGGHGPHRVHHAVRRADRVGAPAGLRPQPRMGRRRPGGEPGAGHAARRAAPHRPGHRGRRAHQRDALDRRVRDHLLHRRAPEHAPDVHLHADQVRGDAGGQRRGHGAAAGDRPVARAGLGGSRAGTPPFADLRSTQARWR